MEVGAHGCWYGLGFSPKILLHFTIGSKFLHVQDDLT
jgi:hypothetical protein